MLGEIKKRVESRPLFNFGIELEGMICKEDNSKLDLDLDCFYASDFIPHNTSGSRFGVDGRHDTWELATKPFTSIKKLLLDIENTVLSVKDNFIPSGSKIMCGPYFSNPNCSGSNNRGQSPCGLHISISINDFYNNIYNHLMFKSSYDTGGILFPFILNMFNSRILNRIEGDPGIYRRNCGYGNNDSQSFRYKSLDNGDCFNGYEFRNFSSIADETLEDYINTYLFLSYIFWSNYIYSTVKDMDKKKKYYINHFFNGSELTLQLINLYINKIISKNYNIITLFRSDFFHNRDNIEILNYFDKYFDSNRKLFISFANLESKYSYNKSDIKYISMIDFYNITPTFRDDYCKKCLRINNDNKNLCNCRNYECIECGSRYRHSERICNDCNRCINSCCNCHNCDRCGCSENNCQCVTCELCGEYNDHIGYNCTCEICPDCGDQFRNLLLHKCPSCGMYLCNNCGDYNGYCCNTCCGSTYIYSRRRNYITNIPYIECRECGTYSVSMSELQCNCGYCTICNHTYRNINEHNNTFHSQNIIQQNEQQNVTSDNVWNLLLPSRLNREYFFGPGSLRLDYSNYTLSYSRSPIRNRNSI